MVFGAHRESLLGGVVAEAAWDRPGLQHPVVLESQVVVQLACFMAVDHEHHVRALRATFPR